MKKITPFTIFDEQDLRGVDFSGINISACVFDDCQLEEVNFSHSNLYGSRFFRANAQRAIFVGATLSGCNFDRCILTGANFQSSIISLDSVGGKATFIGADLTGIVFDENTDFSGALFSHDTTIDEDLKKFLAKKNLGCK